MRTVTVFIGNAPYLVGMCRCGWETLPSVIVARNTCGVQDAEEEGADRKWRRERLTDIRTVART